MPQDIYIVGSMLSDTDKERLISQLGVLEDEISKQAAVHFVDSVDDVPKGVETSIVRFQREQEAIRQFELKVPEVEMLPPMGHYNDGKTNRRERRRQEREKRKHRKWFV